MDTRDIHELTAAYALDALDAEEAEAYEAHLGQCERCRADLAALTETAASLAWAVDAPAPPARLRGRILAAAAAEHANVVPLRRPWLLRATAAAAAVAACTAVGLGVWAGSLSRSLHDARSARAADARAVEILADRASRRIGLSGGNGLIAIAPDGEGVLVVRRLAPAPSNRTYEAWVIPHGRAPRPAALFHGGGAATIVRLGGSVPAGATVAVTVERAGGAPAPTRAPIFTARA